MTNSTLTALKDELAVEQWKSYVDDKTCCVEHAVIEASRAAFDAALKAVRYKEVYEALEYYADKSTWKSVTIEDTNRRFCICTGADIEYFQHDSQNSYCGKRARQIIAQLPKPEGE